MEMIGWPAHAGQMKVRTPVLSLVGLTAAALGVLGAPLILGRPTTRTALPPLAQGLPANIHDAEAAFAARIAETFSLSSSETVMVQRLVAEGFTERTKVVQTPTARTVHWAFFEQQGSACRLVWRVDWQGERDKLTSVSGTYSAICL